MGAVIVASAFFLAGTHLVLSLIPPHVRVLRSRRWRSAAGLVVHADLTVGYDSEPRWPHFWTPRVQYIYVVDGQKYVNDRLNFVGFTAGQAFRERMKYEDQRDVTVWYNPQNPADAVLHKNATWSSILFTAAALAWFIIAGFFLVTFAAAL